MQIDTPGVEGRRWRLAADAMALHAIKPSILDRQSLTDLGLLPVDLQIHLFRPGKSVLRGQPT